MMNQKKYFLVLLVFVGILFFLLTRNHSVSKPLHTDTSTEIKIAGSTLSVDLATTTSTRAQGLSGRTRLEEDKGMLFIFDYPDKYAFWMKDMNFPIDMIWLDQDRRVVYIQKDAEPISYPETFAPSEDAKYVLEVVSGFSDKHNLKVGDTAEFLKE